MATGLFNLKQVNQAISQGAWSGYIAPKWVEYLVVAGGGGGGSRSGGGAGAGGLLTGIVTVAAGTSYTVTVGSGGAGGVDSTSAPTGGNNSVFGSITSAGGGYGSSGRSPGNSGGSSGGSGGGGSYSTGATSSGQGTSGQGNAGSVGFASTTGNYLIGGSGGGAGTVALNGVNSSTSSIAGYGGAGIASAISGSVVVYAGGGGGGSELNAAGSGGVGGGGSGGYAANGASGGGNTGGGGGGGGYSTYSGGAGGSGIVVVRYPGNVQFFTGGTLSYANGYMIHTFYASGTLAPTTPTPYVTDYQISRSLRFNSADSAYLNRTPASASNRKTWTWSGWVKASAFSFQSLFGASDGTNYCEIYFGGNLGFDFFGGGARSLTYSTAAFRDPSAWYHIVIALDTTQATDSNRVKAYVNGVEILLPTVDSGNRWPLQNAEGGVNTTSAHNLGRRSNASSYFNGYMTEVNFIDGQALTPSSFGYTDPDTGVWSPLAFVGAYGTNGFYLNFSDNSNTTAATLGKDYSGNGNNWTPNNFSVTAGAGNDSLVDSPTSYGGDSGAGGEVRGNYATFNPIGGVSNPSTLTNGNLDVTTPATGVGTTVSTIQIPSSGKYYCEITFVTDSAGAQIGIVDFATVNTNMPLSPNCVTYASSGVKFVDGSSSSYGSSYTTGDIIGLAINADTGSITFYKNNTSQGAITHAVAGLVIGVCDGSNSGGGSVFTGNFGQRPFAYTAPSGFKALCTQNLPTPTIGATTATLASQFFAPVTYTGLGATQTVTVGFQPDFTWIKNRTLGANWHVLTDSVRGVQKEIYTNSTAAEATLTTSGVNQFNAGGFQILGNTNDYNGSTSNYVAWNWRASKATAVSNTAGSITSTVSANTTSGFSVVTYTGNGTQPSTVGHGLGVAPSFVIVKTRNSASYDWNCYHISLGNTQYIALNTTAAASSAVSLWNNTTPTSTVFTVNHVAVNTSSNTYVAYCFAPVAGYSAFGSYTGNGSADGPFIFTGFRPAYVMVKQTNTSGGSWIIFDNARDTYNAVDNELFANLSNADAASPSGAFDFVSNGFKVRSSAGSRNDSGGTYIYAAFASAPLKYTLAF